MKHATLRPTANRLAALRALKIAIVEGATWRYEHLVALATAAGVSDDEIDLTAHEALEGLLSGAEKPLTAHQLAHDWNGGHFRP